MTIRIDPEVFNTHKAHDALLEQASEGADTMQEFLHKLVSATHIHDDGPRTYFQVIDFEMGEEAETVKDFGLFAQHVVNEKGDVDKTGLVDLSFGVHKDPYHLLQSACVVRNHSTLEQDDATGAFTLQRSNAGMMMVGTDFVDDLGNNLFTWVFERVPDEDRAQFLQNCEDAGLIATKQSIGFGTPAQTKTYEATPSVH